MANNTFVQTYEKVFLFIFVIYCIWNHFFTHERWVPILDSFNLAIHEAGHPFFAMIHRDLMIYGGTIFQLIIPLLFIFYFKKHQNSIAFSFSLIWFAENLFNIARYVHKVIEQGYTNRLAIYVPSSVISPERVLISNDAENSIKLKLFVSKQM